MATTISNKGMTTRTQTRTKKGPWERSQEQGAYANGDQQGRSPYANEDQQGQGPYADDDQHGQGPYVYMAMQL